MSEVTSYRNLNEVLAGAVARNGNRSVFGTKRDGRWQWITYNELAERVANFRGGLAELGVGRGDTVAVISGNRVEWAVAAYATYSLGARFCPMYENQLEKDWEYILTDSEAKIVLASTYPIYEALRDWPSKLDTLEGAFCMALPAEDEGSFLSLEARGKKNPAPVAEVEPEEICGFIYTSGTTGKPKGVLLSHGNICSNVNAVSSIFPLNDDDLSLSFLPWAHSFGQTCELHCMLGRGASVAFVESIENLVPNLAEVRPTVLFSVPRIWNRIYDGLQKKMAEDGGLKKTLFDAGMANEDERRRLAAEGKSSFFVELKHKFFDKLVFSKVRGRLGGRLRFAISGGAALSPEVGEFIDKLGIFVCEGYGLTETSPIATANTPIIGRKIGSVGKAIPEVEIQIDTSVIDDPDSRDGEIIVKGPNVMQGYHGLDAETRAVLSEDGAFRTGDLGRIDAEGFLFITGRIKEQYKLENGKYVVPAPIEELLGLSGFISQAFVFGDNKPHNVALIVPDAAALEGWARGQGMSTDGLLENPKVRELIAAELEKQSTEIKGYEKIRDFYLIGEEFSVENGMLTPKMSIKRNVVIDRYRSELDGLYAN